MEALATDRLTLPAGRAPGGLALVQELVNTATRRRDEASSGPDDLLADVGPANRWLGAALARWAAETGQPAPESKLTEADLPALRRVREAVRALASRGGDGDGGGESENGDGAADPVAATAAASASLTANVSLRVDASGRVLYGTTATGWRGIAALVLAEVLLAQRTGDWERFKACPYPVCGVAFYDGSRNNSRVWHDVRTCGNRTNLAASRRRRRSADAESTTAVA